MHRAPGHTVRNSRLAASISSCVRLRELEAAQRARVHASGIHALVRRLKLAAVLKSHTGCVNTVNWNERGDMLVSGGDDTTICVWDYYARRLRLSFESYHSANIFCTKFLPASEDQRIISCSGDFSVRVFNTSDGTLLSTFECHRERVKKLSTLPGEPNVFLSVSEDSSIRFFDLRSPHDCSSTECGNCLVDLRSAGISLVTLAVNPVNPCYFATAGVSPFVRIYDRRMQGVGSTSDHPMHLIAPPHLSRLKEDADSQYVTGVAYSSVGSLLAASYSHDNVYCFDPVNACKSMLPPFPDEERVDSAPLANGRVNAVEPSGTGQSRAAVVARLRRRLRQEFSLGTISQNMVEPSGEPKRAAIDTQEPDSDALMTHMPTNQESVCMDDAPESFAPEMAEKEEAGRENARVTSDGNLIADTVPSQLNQHQSGDRNHKTESLAEEAEERMRSVEHDLNEVLEDLEREKIIPTGQQDMEAEEEEFIGPRCPEEYRQQSAEGFVRARRPEMSKSGEEEEINATVETRECTRDRSCLTYSGHCNVRTIKEVNFFGPNSEYVMSGSDDGSLFLWDTNSMEVVQLLQADDHILNCLQGHPFDCVIATSGIENVVKLWTPHASKPTRLRKLQSVLERNKNRARGSRGAGRVVPISMILTLLQASRGTVVLTRENEEQEDSEEPMECEFQ